MPIYRLGSSPLVHAPGLIAWAINAYAFPRDRAAVLRVVTETWPGLPEQHARLLLSSQLSYRLEDDTLVLDVPEPTNPVVKPRGAAPAPARAKPGEGR